MKNCLLLCLSLLCFLVRAQRKYTNKHGVGMELFIGHSYPNFQSNQTFWKAGLYGAGGMHISWEERMTQKFLLNAGLGLSAYALKNKGPVDDYILDYASPHMMLGGKYLIDSKRNGEGVFGVSLGGQLSYKGTINDNFDLYSVSIQGSRSLTYFVRADLGIRKYFDRSFNRAKPAYEFGTFFRYNLTSLGTARFASNSYDVILEPKGHVMGLYARVYVSSGRARFRLEEIILPGRPSI